MGPVKTAPLYITRFIAAYCILCQHFLPGGSNNPVNFQEAVNYFYFLSGFVLMVSSSKFLPVGKSMQKFNSRQFWLRRAAKIYPLYFLAFIMCTTLTCIIFPTSPFITPKLWGESIGVQTWFNEESLNYPAWSVSCELFFYLLFPLTFIWLAQKRLSWVAWAAILIFCVNFVFNTVLFNHWHGKSVPTGLLWRIIVTASLNQHPIFKYPIFLLGNITGLLYISGFKTKRITANLNVCICLMSILLMVVIAQLLPNGSRMLINGALCPLYAVFVLTVCNLSGRLLTFLSSTLFIVAGEMSYAVYIFQVPVAILFRYCFNHNSDFTSYAMFFIFTLVLIIFSYCMYRYIEVPVRKIIIRKFSRA